MWAAVSSWFGGWFGSGRDEAKERALVEAVTKGDEKAVVALLADPQVRVELIPENLMRAAAAAKSLGVFKLLLADGRADPFKNLDESKEASTVVHESHTYFDLMRALFKDGRAVVSKEILINQLKEGSSLALCDEKIPGSLIGEALKHFAKHGADLCHSGRHDPVKILVEDKRCSAKDAYHALCIAAKTARTAPSAEKKRLVRVVCVLLNEWKSHGFLSRAYHNCTCKKEEGSSCPTCYDYTTKDMAVILRVLLDDHEPNTYPCHALELMLRYSRASTDSYMHSRESYKLSIELADMIKERVAKRREQASVYLRSGVSPKTANRLVGEEIRDDPWHDVSITFENTIKGEKKADGFYTPDRFKTYDDEIKEYEALQETIRNEE